MPADRIIRLRSRATQTVEEADIYVAAPDDTPGPPLAARGHLYALRSRRKLIKSFPIVQDNLNNVPLVDVDAYFKASPRMAQLPLYHCRVIIDKYHLLLVGYVDNELDPNHFLSLIGPSTLWRGELALFQLGKNVPTLSTIRCPARFVRAAILTFISRTTEALDGGKAPPSEIIIPH